MPELTRAELIEGVVHVPSPASDEYHAEPDFEIVTWLGHYQAATPGLTGGDSATVILDPKNAPQPDVLLRVRGECGGQSERDARGFLHGAPELAAELAASSASHDLHEKKEVYRRHGVREYIVWRVYDEAVDWFVLREDQYEKLEPDPRGVLKSRVFPGLWLDVAALLRHDLAEALKVLEQGIRTPEHAAFVAHLEEQARRRSSGG